MPSHSASQPFRSRPASDLAAHAHDILNEAEARPVVLTQPYEPNCIVYSDHAADVHDSALRITGALLTLLEMDDSDVGESLPRIFDRAEALSPHEPRSLCDRAVCRRSERRLVAPCLQLQRVERDCTRTCSGARWLRGRYSG